MAVGLSAAVQLGPHSVKFGGVWGPSGSAKALCFWKGCAGGCVKSRQRLQPLYAVIWGQSAILMTGVCGVMPNSDWMLALNAQEVSCLLRTTDIGYSDGRCTRAAKALSVDQVTRRGLLGWS